MVFTLWNKCPFPFRLLNKGWYLTSFPTGGWLFDYNHNPGSEEDFPNPAIGLAIRESQWMQDKSDIFWYKIVLALPAVLYFTSLCSIAHAALKMTNISLEQTPRTEAVGRKALQSRDPR